MCLWTVYKGRKEKSELAKLPNMIICWKVVRKKGNQHGRRYAPEYNHSILLTFLTGWNKTKPKRLSRYVDYLIAFHAFRTKIAAEDWMGKFSTGLHLVKCKTRKKDIVAIGTQKRGNLCLVTKRIWIPKPT